MLTQCCDVTGSHSNTFFLTAASRNGKKGRSICRIGYNDQGVKICSSHLVLAAKIG